MEEKIVFEPISHTYTNVETQELYTPVSNVIAKYKKPFVATKSNTARTEERLDMTHEEVIEHWKKINIASTVRGNIIHEEIEEYLLSNGDKEEAYRRYWFRCYTDDTRNALQEVPYEYLDGLLRKRAIMHIEKLVYNHEEKIAGTPDLVFEYKNHLEVYDWKTNQKDLHQCYKDNTLLPPYDFLPASPYSTYLLQAYYYNKMLESIYNKPVKKNILLHIYNGYRELDITKDLKKLK